MGIYPPSRFFIEYLQRQPRILINLHTKFKIFNMKFNIEYDKVLKLSKLNGTNITVGTCLSCSPIHEYIQVRALTLVDGVRID